MICWKAAAAKLQPYPASNTCVPTKQPHHLQSDTCVPARLQPHPAEIRRWRRQSVRMGRKICVCLSRCNPWRDISSGVGNSSAQTVDDHVPREWEDPQAKRGGGMERSGSLCGRVADPREPLHGRECGSIGKQLRVSKSGPGAPDC